MKPPPWTPRLRRRLGWALVPFRAAASALMLWSAWSMTLLLDGPLPGNVAAAMGVGLLVGCFVCLYLVAAIFVWWPLPDAPLDPDRIR